MRSNSVFIRRSIISEIFVEPDAQNWTHFLANDIFDCDVACALYCCFLSKSRDCTKSSACGAVRHDPIFATGDDGGSGGGKRVKMKTLACYGAVAFGVGLAVAVLVRWKS